LRVLQTQERIMSTWQGNIDKPLVSVCCVTYNHENYIAEALDSFLTQETDFPFEVIVRDDASPDKTAEIIREYEEKYPNIIKPIYEIENGFQKGIKAFPATFLKAKGEYIALCEGDDYWIDNKKLQIQKNEMERCPEVDMSFHPAKELKNGKIGKNLAQYTKENKIFTTSEVLLGGGGFCPSASLVFRKNVLLNLPEWFYTKAPIGDYFYQVFGAKRGGALYINNIMSVYRIGQVGSWTHSMYHQKRNETVDEIQRLIKKKEQFFSDFLETLDDLNIHLDKKYTKEINYTKANIYFEFALWHLKNKNYKKYKDNIKKSFNIYKLKSLKFIFSYNLRLFPKFAYLLRKIYKKIV